MVMKLELCLVRVTINILSSKHRPSGRHCVHTELTLRVNFSLHHSHTAHLLWETEGLKVWQVG